MSEQKLEQQLADAQDNRRAAIKELEYLQGHDHSSDSPRIGELQQEITSLNQQISELQTQLGPDRDAPDEDEDEHEGEVLCPICGGWGGESYGSDSGTCGECGGTGYVDANWGEGNDEEDDDEEVVSRDYQYGVFEMWEGDVAELIVKPESLGDLGACEDDELAAMDVASMEALSNIILGLYHQWKAGSTKLVWSEDIQVAGENADDWEEGMAADRKGFAVYLTFDCREWLKVGAEQEGGEQQ